MVRRYKYILGNNTLFTGVDPKDEWKWTKLRKLTFSPNKATTPR
jgi:hypothetical protein